MDFKIKIDDAIKVLEEHFEAHKKELDEALPVWSEKVKEATEKFSTAVGRKAQEDAMNQLYSIWHTKPIDNRNQYAKFLGGLRHTRDAGQLTVDIDEDVYDRIFLDNWDWRVRSLTANSTYSRSAAAKLGA